MNHEINRKRKNNNNQDFHHLTNEAENDMLTLSLNSFRPSRPKKMPPPPDPPLPPPSPPMRGGFMQTLMAQTPPHHPLQLSASHPLYMTSTHSPPTTNSMPLVYRHQEPGRGPTPSRPTRVRRNPTQAPRQGKGEAVPAPFPWATTRRATVHTLEYLKSRQIATVTGDVQCKRCERRYEMEYSLEDKFLEVGTYIALNKVAMSDRAPSKWNNPALPACKFCEQENSVKPIIAEKKKMINWLFLLLGQMIGCCTLEQLKYFCKHTKNHRTGAKDRLLYLTYLGLCKQLDPEGPFSR